MSMMNVWRIPLLFFVSGMGLCFAMQRRDWRQLMLERSRRILLPFIFGCLLIVPIQVLLWQRYYNQVLSYSPMPHHLWFLGNIFIYVVLLSPLFFWLKSISHTDLGYRIKSFFSSPLGLISVLALLIGEVLITSPISFETYAMNWHGFTLGLICFGAGFIFVYSGKPFWEMIKRYSLLFISLGILLYLIRYFKYELLAPYPLMAAESLLFVLSIFSLGYRFMNVNSWYLGYLSQAAYPIYILHMLFLNLSCSFVFGMDIPIELQYTLVVLGTFIGCFATYEFLIRRTPFLRPLFGLTIKRKEIKKLELA